MGWGGIILAGGAGSRLHPLTQAVNKHLMPVYDKPMIYYPLATLMLAGIRDIVLVSSPDALPLFHRLLGDGSQWGITVRYRPQERPNGIAEGFRLAAPDLGGRNVCLILGDNIFYGSGFPAKLKRAADLCVGASIFSYDVADPSAFGIVTVDDKGNPVDLVEKPKSSSSRMAVPGLYFYTADVFEVAERMKPSARGELEITDVNLHYLREGRLKVDPLGRGIAWLDGGTPEDLYAASQYVEIVERRTGLKIACPEEIAWRLGFIDADAFRRLAQKGPDGAYQRYLSSLL